jgi:hypothetical protein
MAASGQQLETKAQPEDMGEVTHQAFSNTVPADVSDIVLQYAFPTEWVHKQFLFGNAHTAIHHVLSLAEYAGPLDQFEFYVRQYAENLKKTKQKNKLLDETLTIDGVQGTLIQILISKLDLTIRKENGWEIDEGMANRFTKLVGELWPDRLQEVLKQAPTAAPLEDAKAMQEREATHIAAINTVFDAIGQNDEKITQQGIETFKEFVKTMKQQLLNDKGCLTDNRYYLNLIHLIYGAFDVLARRGGELLPINSNDPGQWYGAKADRFCFELIGAVLQLDLPPRVRQLSRSGLHYIFENNKKVVREVDQHGEQYFGIQSRDVLGVNFYYDPCGRGRARGGPGGEWVAVAFSKLLRTITSASKIYAATSLSTTESQFSNVGILRSSVATSAT